MGGFTGVVLAGGVSRRMGQDKALLTTGAGTMLDHMTKLLRLVGASKIIVLGRGADVLGRGAEAVSIPDKTPHEGPAVALLNYLDVQPNGSKHLILPVDMPALTVELLTILAHQSGWAYFENHPLPCMAIASLASGQFSRRIKDIHLNTDATALCVPSSTHHCFANINTPRDYDDFRLA